MDGQPRTLTINGARYTRSDADYSQQIDRVCAMLGEEMYHVLTESEAIIAGGAILSAFTHQEINDIDVYFKSKESMARAFVRLTKKWDSVYLGHTDKSITLKDRDTNATVQFIYFDYFASAEAVFEAFDFTVCMAAIELGTLSFVSHQDFISDMASRTIHFNKGTRFPYVSLARTKKYQERGYTIGHGNLLAIAHACAQIPISSWEQAKHQLGGIYGDQIILAIEKDEAFSAERLHYLLTQVQEYKPINHSDYEAIFKELTGKSPNEINDVNELPS